jgi:hypothetical protein
LAIEENVNANKDLTVSNKILQYIQAGIKVFATDTAGQVEVQAYFPDRICLMKANADSMEWTDQLQKCINMPLSNNNSDLETFNNVFSKEAQEKKLTQLAEVYFS